MKKEYMYLRENDLDEFIEYIDNLDIQTINPNIKLLYKNPQTILQRQEAGIELIELCKMQDKIVGCICAVANSADQDSVWNVAFFYLSQGTDETCYKEMLANFVYELNKRTFLKITSTFLANQKKQQEAFIECGFVPEGYFRSAIGKVKDLITYSLFAEER